jgi:hypothetical protein
LFPNSLSCQRKVALSVFTIPWAISLSFFIGFYSWILEKISIYGSYLMCLAELYWRLW